ncbi:MAG: SDR family NAD(P)-dependent oxidoreductase [Candidatus Nanopelagicales bacterium]
MGLPDRFDLTGRVAVVTGGGQGLGEGFARALGEAGAAVAVLGRTAETGAAAVAELVADGIRAEYIACDVTDEDQVAASVEAVLAAFGRVDILVNNAGACTNDPALETSFDDWRSVMAVNLDGLWLCSRAYGRVFVEQGWGVIVNIGSMSGIIVNRPQLQPAYNASKAAVHHLTKSLAAEWGESGVRVNALAPGYIRTAMSPVDKPQYQRHWIEDTPMKRAGTVEELAPAVVFLASDASSFITGAVLVADGGYTAF